MILTKFGSGNQIHTVNQIPTEYLVTTKSTKRIWLAVEKPIA